VRADAEERAGSRDIWEVIYLIGLAIDFCVDFATL
jgi:hypothetical protein